MVHVHTFILYFITVYMTKQTCESIYKKRVLQKVYIIRAYLELEIHSRKKLSKNIVMPHSQVGGDM